MGKRLAVGWPGQRSGRSGSVLPMRYWLGGAALTVLCGAGLLTAQMTGLPRDGSRGGGWGGAIGNGSGQTQIATTPDDFYQPGTQPDPLGQDLFPITHSDNCLMCHGNYLANGDYAEPWNGWVNSMMAQSARDPVFHAAVTIANQDVAGSGEFCIRCHAPGGWLAGRSTTGLLDDLLNEDFDGINCIFCHRLVNPVLGKDSPAEDAAILQALGNDLPGGHEGNARYVVDPVNSRRGPFDDIPLNMHEPDPIIYSPFHRDSALCGACHDVSNPIYVRQQDGTFLLAPLGEPHPTQNPHDMMPEQRTFSEWLHSDFAAGGVHFPDGRFGGNHPTGIMQSCQDCHMPKKFTGGCFAWEFDPFFPRPDMPMHHFAGANTWVLGAVLDHHGSIETGLTQQSVDDAHARTADMLRNAADLDLEILGNELRVRVTNWSGHKLPTGYPEGRRMWLNVQFLDGAEQLVAEHGHYDFVDAELVAGDTKVYEVKLGMDETVAAMTGLPAGASFHLMLNNEILFDNRIPPVGFTNAAYEAVRAQPVGYAYADGQHWDDTYFDLPQGAEQAVVTLYYQTTTKEYITFLLEQNHTDNTGQTAYDLWVAHGKSAPLDMASAKIGIDPVDPCPADLSGNGSVGLQDLLLLINQWGTCADPNDCPADLSGNGSVGLQDLLLLINQWGPCP